MKKTALFVTLLFFITLICFACEKPIRIIVLDGHPDDADRVMTLWTQDFSPDVIASLEKGYAEGKALEVQPAKAAEVFYYGTQPNDKALGKLFLTLD